MNKWSIMKKLNVLMLLAILAALCFFVVFMDAREHLRLYDWVLGVVAMAAFLLFLGIFIFWLRRTVFYIQTLNEEIHMLEGGELTREITIRGNDEIGMLAESIDDFRESMKDQLGTIEQLEKNNRLRTAEVAHDLRTPLTSLIMYLDFALSELGDREPQVAEYVTKARGRSVRLKLLIDENFDYSTIKNYTPAQKQKEQAYEILSVYLRDMMTYLENEGFIVRVDILYGHSSILILRDTLGRVFSNLASNIMKYAAKGSEILFFVREMETHVEVRITNEVRRFEGEKPEGSGLGNRIVKRLMKEMDGEYCVEEADGKYSTILRFAKA